MAQRLRAAVYGKVLGTGGTFEMVTEALQSADIGLPQAGGEIGIFTVGFMAAAPAGITKDIYIGRPEAQTVVDITVSLFGELVEFGAALCGSGIRSSDRGRYHGLPFWRTG